MGEKQGMALENGSTAHRARPVDRAGAAPHGAPRRSSPARWRLLLIAGCALPLLLAGLCALQVLLARDHLARGAAFVQAAHLGSPLELRQASARRLSRSRLLAAQGELAAARGELGPWSPLLRRLGWAPFVGSQLAAAPPAADASYDTVSSAIHLIDGLQPLFVALRARGPLASRLVVALDRGHRAFTQARGDADRAAGALASLPRHTGNATLDRAAARLRRDLPPLRAAETWLALAPDILGARRPTTYLAAFQDSHELRATGGFVAAVDLVTLRRGVISTSFSSSALPRETMAAFPPLPEAYYTPETRWILRDSNWSPDFPLSARLERWFYGEDTGRWV
ncbi:MAG: DUF4012 domain-containing protein, partial [Chloroflexi bacterium]|nr:DUF4012 domain-containing protein [Chloroflexota bacterium]